MVVVASLAPASSGSVGCGGQKPPVGLPLHLVLQLRLELDDHAAAPVAAPPLPDPHRVVEEWILRAVEELRAEVPVRAEEERVGARVGVRCVREKREQVQHVVRHTERLAGEAAVVHRGHVAWDLEVRHAHAERGALRAVRRGAADHPMAEREEVREVVRVVRQRRRRRRSGCALTRRRACRTARGGTVCARGTAAGAPRSAAARRTRGTCRRPGRCSATCGATPRRPPPRCATSASCA